MDSSNVSEHSRGIALALAGVTGVFGCHRFYVGKTGTGILMLGTLGGLGVWYLYDLILIAAGAFKDAEGKRVVEWSVGDERPHRRAVSEQRADALLDAVDGLRDEVSELEERVDFMERMLTSVRERNAIPPHSSTR